jgi:small subunit ribosomal protein S8
MDTIGDMLSIIKNALQARKETCQVPYSNQKWALANLLANKKRLKSVEKVGSKEKPKIKIELDYLEGEPKIETLKRISKPGRRKYTKANEIYPPKFGFLIISTSQGLKTATEAKDENLGGEILCRVR